jgi:hypothetical protein
MDNIEIGIYVDQYRGIASTDGGFKVNARGVGSTLQQCYDATRVSQILARGIGSNRIQVRDRSTEVTEPRKIDRPLALFYCRQRSFLRELPEQGECLRVGILSALRAMQMSQGVSQRSQVDTRVAQLDCGLKEGDRSRIFPRL